jgi:hypothetical protein
MSSRILAPISVGELIDKITILSIKLDHTSDAGKIQNITKELDELSELLNLDTIIIRNLSLELKCINEIIWQIEDDIRIKEKSKLFDQEFIDLARSVYIYNDKRAVVKRQINELTNSHIVEEKIY